MILQPEQIEKFYTDGYLEIPVKKSVISKKLFSSLHDIQKKILPTGFSLTNSKFEHGYDLDPAPYKMDPVYLDFIDDQKILFILSQLGYGNLKLGYCKVRSAAGGKSYTTPHRDTQFYLNKKKGNIPPLINLNIYYQHSGPSRQLYIYPGTHIRHQTLGIFDRIVSFFRPKKIINSSNTNMLLFNTAVWHKVPKLSGNNHVRLIYSFAFPHQLSSTYFSAQYDLQKYLEKR